jgi:DNA-binding NarL/FixJ family response regulator
MKRTGPSPAPGAEAVAIVIAARPALYREVLARQLAGEPDFRIAGLARDESGILSLLKKESARVLLLDSESLGPNPEDLVARLRHAAPSTRILLLASHSSDEAVELVLRAGASGLVAKQLGFEVLVRAIRVVAGGELWANRRVTARTVEHLAETQIRDSFAEPLTSRESEIAQGVGRGWRNKEIAQRLRISEKTVKTHLNNIFRKLQVDNRFAVGLYVLKPPSGSETS